MNFTTTSTAPITTNKEKIVGKVLNNTSSTIYIVVYSQMVRIMKSTPIRIYEDTKEEIEKLQSRLRLQDQKISQQELIDRAIIYAKSNEEDFMRFLTGEKTQLEDDPLWKIIHDSSDLGKTDSKKMDDYIYGG